MTVYVCCIVYFGNRTASNFINYKIPYYPYIQYILLFRHRKMNMQQTAQKPGIDRGASTWAGYALAVFGLLALLGGIATGAEAVGAPIFVAGLWSGVAIVAAANPGELMPLRIPDADPVSTANAALGLFLLGAATISLPTVYLLSALEVASVTPALLGGLATVTGLFFGWLAVLTWQRKKRRQ